AAPLAHLQVAGQLPLVKDALATRALGPQPVGHLFGAGRRGRRARRRRLGARRFPFGLGRLDGSVARFGTEKVLEYGHSLANPPSAVEGAGQERRPAAAGTAGRCHAPASMRPCRVKISARPRIFMAEVCSVNWASMTSPLSSFSLW